MPPFEGDARESELPGAPRRAAERYAVRRQVELRCPGWEGFRPVQARNVSAQGILVEMDGDPPRPGETTSLRIVSSAGARAVLEAVVARVQMPDEPGGPIAVGLRVVGFGDLSLAELLPGLAVDRSAPPWKPKAEGRWSAAPGDREDLAPPVSLGSGGPSTGAGAADEGFGDIDIDVLVAEGRSPPPRPPARPPWPLPAKKPPRAPLPPRARRAGPATASGGGPAAGRGEVPAPRPRPTTEPMIPSKRQAAAGQGGRPADPAGAPRSREGERGEPSARGRSGASDPLEASAVGGSAVQAGSAADGGKASARSVPGGSPAPAARPRPASAAATPLPDEYGKDHPTPAPRKRKASPAPAGRRPGQDGALYDPSLLAVGAPVQAPREGLRQIRSRAGIGSAPAFVGRAAPVVGIDFGTTYSKIAFVEGGEVVLVEDEAARASSRTAVPSAVSFDRDGTCLVGEPARELLAVSPVRVVTSVKRLMGLRYSDPLSGGLLGSLACRSFAGPNDSILFDALGQEVTVPEVCARVLEHLLGMARRVIGARPDRAVLTVPVDFGLLARRELELAARIAGIEVEALVHEPVAAAMGCGFDGRSDATVAVVDFGGGTIDSSVVEVGKGLFGVKGAAGDRWLGGDDFDEVLARHVADEFQRTSGIGVHDKAEQWQRLLFDCEEAKRWLSTLGSVDVILPRAALRQEGPVTLLVPVDRPSFEAVTADMIESATVVCRQAADEAGIEPESVDALLATGGTTRIPSVRAALERLFGREAAKGIHPEHAVVIGAAVHGAARQGAELPPDFASRLRDHGGLGHAIGIATAGGLTEPIIVANQRPPVAAHRRYSTSRDGQTSIRIDLVEGASATTGQNRRIGGFVIEGLAPREAGAVTVDVYFELSATSTLHVTAVERASGRRAHRAFDLAVAAEASS